MQQHVYCCNFYRNHVRHTLSRQLHAICSIYKHNYLCISNGTPYMNSNLSWTNSNVIIGSMPYVTQVEVLHLSKIRKWDSEKEKRQINDMTKKTSYMKMRETMDSKSGRKKNQRPSSFRRSSLNLFYSGVARGGNRNIIPLAAFDVCLDPFALYVISRIYNYEIIRAEMRYNSRIRKLKRCAAKASIEGRSEMNEIMTLNRADMELINRIREPRHPAVFVAGGAVRDSLNGVAYKDVDLLTTLTLNQIKTLFGRHATIIGKKDTSKRIVKVRKDKEMFTLISDTFASYCSDEVDISSLHSTSPTNDNLTYREDIGEDRLTDMLVENVSKRDFLCNALLYDPVNYTIHDYVDGIKSMLQHGTVDIVRKDIMSSWDVSINNIVWRKGQNSVKERNEDTINNIDRADAIDNTLELFPWDHKEIVDHAQSINIDSYDIADIEKSFKEDPARMLRAIKVAAKLDLRLADRLVGCIAKHRSLVVHLTLPKLLHELHSLLAFGFGYYSLLWMSITDVLQILLPSHATLLDRLKSYGCDDPFAVAFGFIHNVDVSVQQKIGYHVCRRSSEGKPRWKLKSYEGLIPVTKSSPSKIILYPPFVYQQPLHMQKADVELRDAHLDQIYNPSFGIKNDEVMKAKVWFAALLAPLIVEELYGIEILSKASSDFMVTQRDNSGRSEALWVDAFNLDATKSPVTDSGSQRKSSLLLVIDVDDPEYMNAVNRVFNNISVVCPFWTAKPPNYSKLASEAKLLFLGKLMPAEKKMPQRWHMKTRHVRISKGATAMVRTSSKAKYNSKLSQTRVDASSDIDDSDERDVVMVSLIDFLLVQAGQRIGQEKSGTSKYHRRRLLSTLDSHSQTFLARLEGNANSQKIFDFHPSLKRKSSDR